MFIAVDAIGVLPMFMGLTHDIDKAGIKKVVMQSVLTAMIVALVFLVVGKAILGLLGITVADFMVAGGILLFIISISDILTTEKKQRMVDPESLGAVPRLDTSGLPAWAGAAMQGLQAAARCRDGAAGRLGRRLLLRHG